MLLTPLDHILLSEYWTRKGLLFKGIRDLEVYYSNSVCIEDLFIL